MIDLTINKQGLEHNLKKAKENGIVIPTIAQTICEYLDVDASSLDGKSVWNEIKA